MTDRPTIRTRVAHAGFAEHRFFGRNVFADIVGQESFWSIMSMAAGGPRLDSDACLILDDVLACVLVADPRIWPMKMVRLTSAFGGANAALAVGLLFVAESVIGPPVVRRWMTLLQELRADLGELVSTDTAVDSAVLGLAARENRIPGFGAPLRARDERVTAIRTCIARRGRSRLVGWQLFERAAQCLAREKGLQANAAAAVGAVFADIGLSPTIGEAFCNVYVLVNGTANAWEGARQAPSVLQKLPDDWVRYEGPPPRESPRALAARRPK